MRIYAKLNITSIVGISSFNKKMEEFIMQRMVRIQLNILIAQLNIFGIQSENLPFRV
jgi:hypothetical protein